MEILLDIVVMLGLWDHTWTLSEWFTFLWMGLEARYAPKSVFYCFYQAPEVIVQRVSGPGLVFCLVGPWRAHGGEKALIIHLKANVFCFNLTNRALVGS